MQKAILTTPPTPHSLLYIFPLAAYKSDNFSMKFIVGVKNKQPLTNKV